MAYRYAKSNWADASSPAPEDIAILAEQAFRSLPADFRNLCGDLIVQISEFPDSDTLEEMNCQTPYDILGLFHDADDESAEIADPPDYTNQMHLYRRPILDYWAEHEDTLSEIIIHVLISEIAHHFNLSEEVIDRVKGEAETEAYRDSSQVIQ